MRCIQIAKAIGCDYVTDVKSLEQVPWDKTIFVCVKPNLSDGNLEDLASRGSIIWDIHDFTPPKGMVSQYIASSATAATEYELLSPVSIIPHHHCNHTEIPNTAVCRRAVWIGRPYWQPDFGSLPIESYDSKHMLENEVAAIYRQTGIGINVRAEHVGSEDNNTRFHVLLNGGGKLINCMGFGIPSISSEEPAYREHGEQCTLFTENNDIHDLIEELSLNDTLYEELRCKSFERGRNYHIDRITPLYNKLFEQIDDSKL